MRVRAFKSIYPNKNLLVSPDSFFATMGRDFSKHYQSGLFDESEEKAIYVYQIKIHNHSALGLVLSTDIHDLLDGNILFHEDTIATKEQDMVVSSLEKKAMIKPILLFHKKNKKIANFIKETIEKERKFYDCELASDHNHSFWKISKQEKIEYIKEVFNKEIRKAYIADGHHRCSTTRRLFENQSKQFSDFDFTNILSSYFSVNQVKIYDHVKIVKILDTIKPELFIVKLSKFARIKPAKDFKLPSKAHDFVLILNGEIYNAQWAKKTLNKFRKAEDLLDVNIMDAIVFKRILSIPDIRKDTRISFFSGNSTEKQILDHCINIQDSIALIQYPLKIKDIMQVAKNQKKLPPKSTWFEPKIKSGVIGQKY